MEWANHIDEWRLCAIQWPRRIKAVSPGINKHFELRAKGLLPVDADDSTDFARVQPNQCRRREEGDLSQEGFDQLGGEVIVLGSHNLPNSLVAPKAPPVWPLLNQRRVDIHQPNDFFVGVNEPSREPLRVSAPILTLMVLENRLHQLGVGGRPPAHQLPSKPGMILYDGQLVGQERRRFFERGLRDPPHPHVKKKRREPELLESRAI